MILRKHAPLVLTFLFATRLYAGVMDTVVVFPKNNLNLGILSDGSLFSFNYERLLKLTKSSMFSVSAGTGFSKDFQICIFSSCGPPPTVITFPHHISYNLGDLNSFLEFGVGGVYYTSEEKNFYQPCIIFAIRKIRVQSNKLSFRFAFQMPLKKWPELSPIYSPFGINLGVGY